MALGHPPGLMESPGRRNGFGGPSPRGTGRGDGGKFFIVLPEWFFDSEPLQEGKLVLQLAGFIVAKNPRSSHFPPSPLRGIHERATITECLKIPMSGPEEGEGLRRILEGHPMDMMAAGQPKQASSQFFLNPNTSTFSPCQC
ncbi:hypothetical protein GWK47_027449 [Chionoecetes opilio]|uniref:Uncharacterized protein n=1 Tax=Chionoecetes opilio TaxID=41210 RepID=A0A8J8WCG6_CHIOP|nr:hypothetical protein GWK47_027449 [Chionoecetes opilio]